MTEPQQHNTINVTVSDAGITVQNLNPRLVDATLDDTKVWGRSGGEVIFSVTNNTGVDQYVRIPVAEIKPSPKFKGSRPPEPLLPGRDAVRVPPTKTENIVLKVKDKDYFQWETWEGEHGKVGMTYKYTIYANRTPLDPDIEINP